MSDTPPKHSMLVQQRASTTGEYRQRLPGQPRYPKKQYEDIPSSRELYEKILSVTSQWHQHSWMQDDDGWNLIAHLPAGSLAIPHAVREMHGQLLKEYQERSEMVPPAKKNEMEYTIAQLARPRIVTILQKTMNDVFGEGSVIINWGRLQTNDGLDKDAVYFTVAAETPELSREMIQQVFSGNNLPKAKSMRTFLRMQMTTSPTSNALS